MKRQLSPPVVAALVAAAALILLGLGWFTVNRDTGVIHGGPEIMPGVKLPHKMSARGDASDSGGKRMVAPTGP